MRGSASDAGELGDESVFVGGVIRHDDGGEMELKRLFVCNVPVITDRCQVPLLNEAVNQD